MNAGVDGDTNGGMNGGVHGAATGTITAPEPEPRVTTETAPARRRWCRGTRLLAAAAVLWLVFVALQYLLSGRVWWWQVPNLLPPLVFMAVPVLLAGLALVLPLARVRLPKSARVLVVVLAAVELALGVELSDVNLTGVLFGSAATPTGAHVVSWNTMTWGANDNPERFYANITSQHADVYLLQEYMHSDRSDQPHPVDQLAELQRRFPGYHLAIEGELVTLSRFPIVRVVTPGAVPRTPANWVSVYRTGKVLRTDLLVGTRVVSVYNVHITVGVNADLSPFGAAFYQVIQQRDQQRQAEYRALRADLATNANPLLIAGDFNSTHPVQDLRQVAGRLTDAAAAADQQAYPVSWNAEGAGLWRLDWAFLASGLRATGYRLLDSHGLSDHRMQDMWLTAGTGR